MSANFSIKIRGVESVLKRLDWNKNIAPQVQKAFDNFGMAVEAQAKQNAPVDEGALRSAIYHKSVSLGVEVGCAIEYAAYLEFGTRKFAASYVNQLPAQWRELAARSKGGRGGSWDEFVKRITGWVIRKGISATYTKGGSASKSKSAIAAQHQAAYLIARSILINGIKAQPYLKPAVDVNTKYLLRALNSIKI